MRLKGLGVQWVEYVQIHGGINVEEYHHLRNLKLPEAEPFRFLTSGRLVPWKGVHLALRAFAQANLPEAELWIEGSGPQKRQLMELAEKLGINHQVKFLEGLSRVEAWECLAQCHVLLHPSLHNLFTSICVEAMAAGRPIIGFSVDSAIPSQITTETGINIEAHDPEQAIEEMAAGMRLIESNDSLRMNMGRAGQERVESMYLWENRCVPLERNYFRVLEGTYEEADHSQEIALNDHVDFPQSAKEPQEEAISERAHYTHTGGPSKEND